MITENEIERALDFLRDNAEPAAKARAERLYLEQWQKTVKAQEMAKHGDISSAKAEMLALTSKPYIDALIAYKAAIYEDERIRFLVSAAEAKIEAWRSLEATRRAEGKAYS